jgi:hypothetical protein
MLLILPEHKLVTMISIGKTHGYQYGHIAGNLLSSQEK